MNVINLLKKCKWCHGSQMNQYLMAIMVTMPTMMVGMLLGWMSPTIPILQDVEGPLPEPIQDSDLSWLASSTFLVAFPCMLVAGSIADAIGRKNAILITSFSFLACWLMKLVWVQSKWLILARAVSGVGNAGCYVIPPMYTNEISDENIRGSLGSMLILAQNLGFLIMYICGDLLSFNTVLWISFIIPAVHFALFLLLPDTPSYLVKKGRIEEALEVLAWLRSVEANDKKVVEDIEKLQAEVKEIESRSESAWKSLSSSAARMKAFGISVTSLTIQESCGFLILMTYASLVFNKAGSATSVTPNQQAMVLAAVQLAGSVSALFLIEKMGRKSLLLLMSFMTGTAMLVLGTWFFFNGSHDLPGWIPIAAMCVSIFCTAAGFQPVPYVLLPEMFNFQLRGVVSSIGVAMTGLSDFLQTATFTPLANLIDIHGVFWMFTGICYFGTIFTLLFVPETKGKSLEQIYEVIENNKMCGKKSGQV